MSRRSALRALAVPAFVVLVPAAGLVALSGCAQSTSRMPPVQMTQANPARGARLISSYGCVSCHTVAGVPGDAQVGPPLTGFARRSYIAGELANTPENLQRWIRDPQAVEPGTAMPNLGVSAVDARDIAAYLLSEGS